MKSSTYVSKLQSNSFTAEGASIKILDCVLMMVLTDSNIQKCVDSFPGFLGSQKNVRTIPRRLVGRQSQQIHIDLAV